MKKHLDVCFGSDLDKAHEEEFEMSWDKDTNNIEIYNDNLSIVISLDDIVKIYHECLYGTKRL